MNCDGSGKITEPMFKGSRGMRIIDCPGCENCQPKKPPCYGTGVMRSSSGNYMPCYCEECQPTDGRGDIDKQPCPECGGTHWWCERCQAYIHPMNVTYDERHGIDSCGAIVVPCPTCKGTGIEGGK